MVAMARCLGGCGRFTQLAYCTICEREWKMGKRKPVPKPSDENQIQAAHDEPMPEDEAADLAEYRREYRARNEYLPPASYEQQIITERK